MRGTYRFYVDGVLVAEQPNLITTVGKRAILDCLAGYTSGLGSSIAVGTGSTAATTSDVRLKFEVTRATVVVTSPDYVSQSIVFKGTIPRETQFAISEVGLVSMDEGKSPGRLLLSFDSVNEVWSSGSFQTDTTRIGGDSLRISATASATTTSALSGILIDLSSFSDVDTLTMAYAPQDANLASLKIRFKVDGSNYYEYILPTLTAGYKTVSWSRSQMTKTGSPTWSGISSVDVIVQATAGGATAVDMDGLRIDTTYVASNDYALISRTVLGSPIVKTDVSEMDIEYTLDVTA